jgi:uncharacterized protein YndB with AHSA1/START domain
MAVVRKQIDRPRDLVFTALLTPETFPLWLLGCRAIRRVDDGWPEPGTAFHHRVGLIGPLTVEDNTKVLDVRPPERLVLEVRARPFGRGRVSFVLSALAPEVTLVEMDEVPIGGVGVLRPVLDPLVTHRNRRSLDDLAVYLEADRALSVKREDREDADR